MLYACVTGGNIYKSFDFGESWSTIISTDLTVSGYHYWRSISTSYDGKAVIAVTINTNGTAGLVYKSINGSNMNILSARLGGDNKSVSVSSDGKTVAISSGQIVYIIDTLNGSTLRASYNDPFSPNNVSQSADGKMIVSHSNGNIRISVDYGVNWAAIGPLLLWSYVAISSDGTKVVAVVNPGWIYTFKVPSYAPYQIVPRGVYNTGLMSITASADLTKIFYFRTSFNTISTKSLAKDSPTTGLIYTSTDFGYSWSSGVKYHLTDTNGLSILSSSSDGIKLVAAVRGGYIYTSKDSGVTWTERRSSGKRYWSSIASSTDGTTLIACESYGLAGYIYTSPDSGVTWTKSEDIPYLFWKSVASSADGVKVVAIAKGGYIYISTNSGKNFVKKTSAVTDDWNSVASSADGTKLFALSYGTIYISINSGDSWNLPIPYGNLYSHIYGIDIASSSDGQTLFVVGSGGAYISLDSGKTWNIKSTNSKLYSVVS
jgi:photosystem II stability/assembly factor-like uncharacterized protein